MNNIDLSFCIPTYNRAQIVYGLVSNILLCCDPNIEVVVLDNGSTDDTMKLLQTIKDERLVVYSNGENKGGLYNVVNVTDKAKGKYLVFSTDKDQIDFKEITKFKSFLLQQHGLAGGYCTFNSTSENEFELFPKGYQAVKNIAYKGRHPTGYFFNNELLKSIRHVERFSDYKVVDMFPYEFVFAEVCLLGSGAIYHVPMLTLETGEMAAKHKSYNASGKTKEAFFSPEARLKLAINFTNHIKTLQLAPQEKRALTIDVLIQQLGVATVGYQSILRDKDLCAHYYMDRRDLKTIELLSIGLNFYKQYKIETKALLGGSFTSRMIFELHFFLRLSMKMIRRSIRFEMNSRQQKASA